MIKRNRQKGMIHNLDIADIDAHRGIDLLAALQQGDRCHGGHRYQQ